MIPTLEPTISPSRSPTFAPSSYFISIGNKEQQIRIAYIVLMFTIPLLFCGMLIFLGKRMFQHMCETACIPKEKVYAVNENSTPIGEDDIEMGLMSDPKPQTIVKKKKKEKTKVKKEIERKREKEYSSPSKKSKHDQQRDVDFHDIHSKTVDKPKRILGRPEEDDFIDHPDMIRIQSILKKSHSPGNKSESSGGFLGLTLSKSRDDDREKGKKANKKKKKVTIDDRVESDDDYHQRKLKPIKKKSSPSKSPNNKKSPQKSPAKGKGRKKKKQRQPSSSESENESDGDSDSGSEVDEESEDESRQHIRISTSGSSQDLLTPKTMSSSTSVIGDRETPVSRIHSPVPGHRPRSQSPSR